MKIRPLAKWCIFVGSYTWAKLMPFGIRDKRRRSTAILNESTTCSMQGWKIFEDTSKFGQIRRNFAFICCAACGGSIIIFLGIVHLVKPNPCFKNGHFNKKNMHFQDIEKM
jgi:hypothetical protein